MDEDDLEDPCKRLLLEAVTDLLRCNSWLIIIFVVVVVVVVTTTTTTTTTTAT
jgi:t-SNARE complex subunit (syntaxin)